MKAFYLSGIFLLFLTAQAMAASGFGVGVKGGVSFATQKTSGEGVNVEVKSRLTGHAGAYAHYFILDFLAVQPEILLSMKGSKWDDPYFKGVEKLTYLDIPVLIRFQPFGLLNIHAGPQFGLLVNATNTDDYDGIETDVKEYYKGMDVGLAVGAELNLPYRINVTVRYVLGLTPVTEPGYYVDEWKNNVLQISTGFRIIGK
jgi:hypothetical protein